jgi:hypothetical protein
MGMKVWVAHSKLSSDERSKIIMVKRYLLTHSYKLDIFGMHEVTQALL